MEEWKVVEGYSRYEVSTKGNVRDVKTQKLKALVWNGNFLCTNLYDDNGLKVLCKVHRLVAICFVDNPSKVKKVRHKNGDRSDNTFDNLEWRTLPLKERKISKVQKVTYEGIDYSIKEFSDMVGVSPSVTRGRLREGWTVHECKIVHRTFRLQGITTDTHWFPSKAQKEEYEKLDRKRKLLKKKQDRKDAIEKWRNRGICGVGIRDIDLPSSDPVYKRWSSMISRCYSEALLNKCPSYEDKFVSEDWKYLSLFKQWMDLQDWEGLQLDKDILIKGNKEYRPEACAFVPAYVNSSLCISDRGRGEYPLGVSFNKKEGKFLAKIKSMGKVTDLGLHISPELAHIRWQQAKTIEMENIINMYSKESSFRTDVAEALMKRVWDLRLDISEGKETLTL